MNREGNQYSNLFPTEIRKLILSFYLEGEWVDDADLFFSDQYENITKQYHLAARINSVDLFTMNIQKINLNLPYLDTYSTNIMESNSYDQYDLGYNQKGNSDSLLGSSLDLLEHGGTLGMDSRKNVIKMFEMNASFLEDITKIAIENDCVDIIKYIVDENYKYINIEYKSGGGYQLDTTRASRDSNDSKTMLLKLRDMSAKNGTLNCLKILLQKLLHFSQSTVEEAFEGGHLHIVRFLKQYRYKEILSWYSDNITHIRCSKLLALTARSGNTKLLEWLLEENKEDKLDSPDSDVIDDMFERAIINNQTEMIKYLVGKYPQNPKTDKIIIKAIKHCDSTIFYLLYDRGTSPSDHSGMLLAAAEIGDVDIFRYLRSENTGEGSVGFDNNLNDIHNQVQFGNIGAVHYFHNEHIDICSKIKEEIIKNNDIHFVNYLLRNEKKDIKFDDMLDSIGTSSIDMVKEFEKSYYGYQIKYKDILSEAIKGENMQMVCFLLQDRKNKLRDESEERKQKLNICPSLVRSKLLDQLVYVFDPKNNLDFIEIDISKILSEFNIIIDQDVRSIVGWFEKHKEYDSKEQDDLLESDISSNNLFRALYQRISPYFVINKVIKTKDKFSFGPEVAQRNLYNNLPPELRIPPPQ